MSRRGKLLGALFAIWAYGLIAHLLPAVHAQDALPDIDLQRELVGYWKLSGDCLDYSGRNNHGTNHGVDLKTGSFDGRSAYIEVPSRESLQLGRGDFTISAWVHTDKIVDDTLGDVFSLYDPRARRGVTLNLKASSGGYQSSGDDRHVYFGIDNAKLGQWQDCGRPSPTSNYVSNSLTVFNGHLYAAIIDARDEADWCHVFRYAGGKKWVDCGRVGQRKTTGVMGLIVHQGQLFAGTSTYDWTRVFSGEYEPARVYRYDGGTTWTDCGQPSEMLRINCLATFGGKLYAGGDRGLPPRGEKQWTGRPYRVFAWEGGTKWAVAGELPAEPPKNCYPHAMAVHDGKLYVGYPNVYAFDGRTWEFAGTPIGNTPLAQKPFLQVHSLDVFRGKLLAGMWPEARVVEHRGGEQWTDRGRLGDGTEINALTVYNGKLFAGAIPRGEVSRYDDEQGWTSVHKFFSPPGWEPGPPTDPVREEINNWTRITSLTVYQGLLFASIGSCTSSVKDAPAGVRGSVYSLKAGECISYDKDLGPGWKQLVAQRRGGELRLYIDGNLVAKSAPFRPEDFELSTDQPLRIGFGEQDFFTGRIREVRLYRRALTEPEIQMLQEGPPPAKAPFDSAQAKKHQAAWAQYLATEVTTENSQGIRLVLIPPGEFQMGCPPEHLEQTLEWADRVRQNPAGAERRRISTEERQQHPVALTRPFLMGATEVTIGQYKRFSKATRYVTEAERFGGGNSASKEETDPRKSKATWHAPGYAVTDNSPVTQITWNDAVSYCNWLSEQERLPLAYRQDSAGNWEFRPAEKGYRLPTEAEWEYACRAGTTTQFSFGDDVAELGKYAWYDKNADHLGAGAVGSKLPNPFGLYDMHGNVWERCHDWFDEKWYAQSPERDPVGPVAGTRRMVRGGGWHYFDLHCRSAYRNNYAPISRTGNTGFRLARTW